MTRAAGLYTEHVTTEERFNRIEQLLDRIADTQLQLDGAFATLADSHIKTREDIDRTRVDIDRLIQSGIAQSERIDKLVSGIGELLNRQA